MDNPVPLIKLRGILARLYSDERSASRIVRDAGLKLGKIRLGDSAINNWDSILTQAEDTNKINDLFDVVLSNDEYGDNDELRNACNTYLLSSGSKSDSSNQTVDRKEPPKSRSGSQTEPPDKPVPQPETEPDSRKPLPNWFPKVGVFIFIVTLLFFMWLVVVKYEAPPNSRFLVVAVLALGFAFSTTFLGGWAIVEGPLPILHVKGEPLQVSITGGIAVFVVVLLLGSWVYVITPQPTNSLAPPTPIPTNVAPLVTGTISATGGISNVTTPELALTVTMPLTSGVNSTPSSFCADIGEISQIECGALVALYNSASGATTWYSKTNWLVTNTPCSVEGGWYGVTCANGHVTGLDLSIGGYSNGLSGTIPSELGDLTQLITLILPGDYRNSNKLYGTLPEKLQKLDKLQVLNLQWNAISGDLPDWLGSLPLNSLSLGFNPVTGKIPRTLFKQSLQALDLNYTQISDTIPVEVGESKNLQSLRLFSPNLTGEIPATLDQLTQLTDLIIQSDHRLTGSLSWLPKLTKLNLLWIVGFDGANASGTILSDIATLKNLNYLNLHNDRLNGLIPDTIGQLTQLKCFDLGENQLTGSIPSSFTQLTNLWDQGCNQASFADSGLNLSHNSLNATDPTLLDFLKQKAPNWVASQNYDKVGWWKFDECDGGNIAKDSSGLENDGTLQGGLTLVNDPERLCVLDFTQKGQSLAINYAPSLEPLTGTIELWVKLDTPPPSLTNIIWKGIFANIANVLQEGYGIKIHQDGQISAYIVNFIDNYTPSNDDGRRWRFVDGKQIEFGKWHHLALRWDEQPKLTLFIDGVQAADSQPYTPTHEIGITYCVEHKFADNCQGNVLKIGIPSDGAPGDFIGKMDDLRFYARALSDEEIQHEYRTSILTSTVVFTDNFEGGIDEWKQCYDDGCAKAKLVQPEPNNSNQAVQVSYGDPKHPGIFRFVGNFKRGESYWVSIRCKARFEETCHLGFGDLPNEPNLGYENARDVEANGNEQWQLLRTECQTLTNDELMSVHLYAKGNDLTAIYDDLQVEKLANCP